MHTSHDTAGTPARADLGLSAGRQSWLFFPRRIWLAFPFGREGGPRRSGVWGR